MQGNEFLPQLTFIHNAALIERLCMTLVMFPHNELSRVVDSLFNHRTVMSHPEVEGIRLQ